MTVTWIGLKETLIGFTWIAKGLVHKKNGEKGLQIGEWGKDV